MIRIIKDRKIKYLSLGVAVFPEHWDFDKNKPKSSCPNKDLINKIILDKELEYQKQILELKSEDKEYTASTLIESKIQKKRKSVLEFYEELIMDYKSKDKRGNAKVYNDSLNSLRRYTNKKLDIPFSHIDIDFLKGYEKWMIQNNCVETSMSVFFRTLRSAYNKAIVAKYAKKECYPFNEYKVSKFNTKTEKRAIPKDVIKQIIEVDLSDENEYLQFSRDLFVFSYLCGGINFTDMANLRYNNIANGRLSYIRQKTGKKINVPINIEAMNIISKYYKEALETDNYIFPILDKRTHITEQQRYNRKHKVLEHVNKSLKIISKKIGVEVNLTTYVARHSYATVLKNSGVNIALIGETLGHSDIKTTQIYLDSFENSQIDEAMKNLL